MQNDEFMDTLGHLFGDLFDLIFKKFNLPEPIGAVSYADLMFFFAVAYMLAEFVSLVASRRD